MPDRWTLDPDRCFDPDPRQRDVARSLYERVSDLPLVCPHGHVPPALLADDEPLGDPATLLVVPDHYVVRMLYSQGVAMEDLGWRAATAAHETDPRAIWRRFCERFHLFAGTPTGLWLKQELIELFDVDERPSAANADALFDHLSERLADPAYPPARAVRALGRRGAVHDRRRHRHPLTPHATAARRLHGAAHLPTRRGDRPDPRRLDGVDRAARRAQRDRRRRLRGLPPGVAGAPHGVPRGRGDRHRPRGVHGRRALAGARHGGRELRPPALGSGDALDRGASPRTCSPRWRA
jgi:hypothetical protein